MSILLKHLSRLPHLLLLGMAMAAPWTQLQAAGHNIRGITGPTFNLYAFPFFMNLPEGTSLYMWGFGDMNGGASATHPEGNGYALPQYPAPTLIVNQGDSVTINLTNYGVPDPVSIVVAGHNVQASGGTEGLVTRAAVTGGAQVTYTFTAGNPGTYIYHSLDGANPGLHAEMGLFGALIVRPSGYNADTNRIAYGIAGADYDQEFLYLLSEIDPEVHIEMERGHYTHFTHSDRFATVYLINGRVFPDLLASDFDSLYPHQPYQGMAKAHPGERVLIREANAGHDPHPFHHHGENLRFIARDGRILSSNGLSADLGRSDNTVNSEPKQTADLIWRWTGKDLGWDIYGQQLHACCTDVVNNETGAPGADGFDDTSYEFVADHGKAFPVTLPGVNDLALGGWWSGSPFLGDLGDLPPGEGGLNPFGGYFLMWHSHTEKELTTFDIFPGGSMSAVVVLPSATPIE
jgi:FtsP/CotA-like multicopper oxidase with cupredoxin domain